MAFGMEMEPVGKEPHILRCRCRISRQQGTYQPNPIMSPNFNYFSGAGKIQTNKYYMIGADETSACPLIPELVSSISCEQCRQS